MILKRDSLLMQFCTVFDAQPVNTYPKSLCGFMLYVMWKTTWNIVVIAIICAMLLLFVVAPGMAIVYHLSTLTLPMLFQPSSTVGLYGFSMDVLQSYIIFFAVIVIASIVAGIAKLTGYIELPVIVTESHRAFKEKVCPLITWE